MNKRFISELNKNDRVDSVFMLRKKELKLTKTDKFYLRLTLSDKTGKIEGRLWDDAEKYNEAAETGDIVQVKGAVDQYLGENQIKVDLLAKAEDGAFQYEDMVRVVEGRDGIYKKTVDLLRSIENKWVKALAEEFISDEELMSMFRDGLGAKSWHNAYIGGLMEHTYEVMCIAGKMCDLYPEVDRSLAVFGSFIHDIGKIHELDVRKMEYTTEGGLVGHIAIGYKMLMQKIAGIPDFPDELSCRLQHIILSHHGEYEQQSPVLPKTLEATIIYHADDLVSQTNAVKEIQQNESEGEKVWSNYVNIKNRKYYIKDLKSEEWSTG